MPKLLALAVFVTLCGLLSPGCRHTPECTDDHQCLEQLCQTSSSECPQGYFCTDDDFERRHCEDALCQTGCDDRGEDCNSDGDCAVEQRCDRGLCVMRSLCQDKACEEALKFGAELYRCALAEMTVNHIEVEGWYIVEGCSNAVLVGPTAYDGESCRAKVVTNRGAEIGVLPCADDLICCYHPPGPHPGEEALALDYHHCMTQLACMNLPLQP